jgi:hypothetical protein
MRAWYLRNCDRHKQRARLNYWKDRSRRLQLRRERYYIDKYLVRKRALETLWRHSTDILLRAARAYDRLSAHLIAAANGGGVGHDQRRQTCFAALDIATRLRRAGESMAAHEQAVHGDDASVSRADSDASEASSTASAPSVVNDGDRDSIASVASDPRGGCSTVVDGDESVDDGTWCDSNDGGDSGSSASSVASGDD